MTFMKNEEKSQRRKAERLRRRGFYRKRERE